MAGESRGESRRKVRGKPVRANTIGRHAFVISLLEGNSELKVSFKEPVIKDLSFYYYSDTIFWFVTVIGSHKTLRYMLYYGDIVK